MELKDNGFGESNDLPNEQTQNKPNAYLVDDDDNLTEENLRHGYPTSKDDIKKQDAPGMEGQGMGGQSFGENNLTPSGDDPANPSQNAGYNNKYFRRTQPSEEHPENNNFKDPNQSGYSDYNAATGSQGNGENTGSEEDEKPGESQQQYQEGTADDDGKGEDNQANIPGPNEVPDQQKVGE
jgi:hypothetical protein